MSVRILNSEAVIRCPCKGGYTIYSNQVKSFLAGKILLAIKKR